jgi:tRNA pseudouridine55 synthase
VVRRRADRIHGVLVVDKPVGVTSQDVVTRVRLALGVRSAGHTGTLDPLASGVLPICLGQATKIAQWLIAEDKRYLCTCELGVVSDTHDTDGVMVRRAVVEQIDPTEVEAALSELRGPILQVPPMHSAIQQGGLRLHALARQGLEVERAAREVRVDALVVRAVAAPRIDLAIACSKGTYVRALVRDLGERLGTGAVVTTLRRTASGAFTEADAVGLGELDRVTVAARLIPTARALGLPQVEVDDSALPDVINGHERRLARYAEGFANGDRFQLVSTRGETLAVCQRRAGYTFLERVLTYEATGLDVRPRLPQSPPPGQEPGPD